MTVTTHEVEVRVRAPRIAVVVSSHTTADEVLQVIQFLSLVRGGKYARFLFADMNTLDFVEFLETEGRMFQPELIIGAGEQDRLMLRHVFQHARPQALKIPDDPSKSFAEHELGGLLPWYRVTRKEYEKQPNLKRDNIYLLNSAASPGFHLLVATLYGRLPEEIALAIKRELQTEIIDVTINSAEELYALNVLMAPRLCWLDFLNLDSGLVCSSLVPPTIVVVEEEQPLRSLALFWNLSRQYSIRTRDESILLFREQDVGDKIALSAAAETISRTTISSDYCHVISGGSDASPAEKIAKSLRLRLRKGKTTSFYVDVKKSVVAPYVQCCEKNENTTISRDGSIVTVPRINPIYESSSSSGRWYLDLVKARKTNRFPFEYSIPKDRDLLDLLNVPSGQFVAFRRLVSFSEECLSISLTSSDSCPNVRFELPSERELFEVVFQRASWTVRTDEKNTRYARFLGLFPGLSDAARAITGNSWKIVDAFRAGPLTDDELRSKARTGKRTKFMPLPEMAGMVRDRYQGLYGDLFERRVRRDLQGSLSEGMPTEHVLEYLVRRNVLFRKWKLDKCPGCEREYWMTDLDIRVPLRCPGCGDHIPYKDKVRLGYEINPLVELALKEGARPVLLAARFLQGLTWHGFLMYPGAKIGKGDRETDLDLCAVGDEILIAGECKNLAEVKKGGRILWGDILTQLMLPIEAAKACGFKVFRGQLYGSVSKEFPRRRFKANRRLTQTPASWEGRS